MKVVWFIWLLPRNAVIGLLIGYRKWISPLYGDVCRYYPTCSSYGLQQVQQRGLVLGVPLTAWRILRCNPWSKGGTDEVQPAHSNVVVTKRGFVLPPKF